MNTITNIVVSIEWFRTTLVGIRLVRAIPGLAGAGLYFRDTPGRGKHWPGIIYIYIHILILILMRLVIEYYDEYHNINRMARATLAGRAWPWPSASLYLGIRLVGASLGQLYER